jgi:hypothetical protein
MNDEKILFFGYSTEFQKIPNESLFHNFSKWIFIFVNVAHALQIEGNQIRVVKNCHRYQGG